MLLGMIVFRDYDGNRSLVTGALPRTTVPDREKFVPDPQPRMWCFPGVGHASARAHIGSVGDVLTPPAIGCAPALCAKENLLDILLIVSALPSSFLCVGIAHMSVPYRIRGSTTLVVRHLAFFGVSPMSGLTALRFCVAHAIPFLIALASRSFQPRSWSRMVPRYMTYLDGSIVVLAI